MADQRFSDPSAYVEVSPLLGRLSWAALPYDPIVIGTFCVVALGGLSLIVLITRYKLWGYLWREWFTTVDHKKIGIMYMILGIVMLLRGFGAVRISFAASTKAPIGGSERAKKRRNSAKGGRPVDMNRSPLGRENQLKAPIVALT